LPLGRIRAHERCDAARIYGNRERHGLSADKGVCVAAQQVNPVFLHGVNTVLESDGDPLDRQCAELQLAAHWGRRAFPTRSEADTALPLVLSLAVLAFKNPLPSCRHLKGKKKGKSRLNFIKIDAKRKRLITSTESGCCYHEFTEHVVRNNRPVAVFRVIEEFDGSSVTVTRMQRVGRQWRKTTKR
jgi:hypothetical protein